MECTENTPQKVNANIMCANMFEHDIKSNCDSPVGSAGTPSNKMNSSRKITNPRTPGRSNMSKYCFSTVVCTPPPKRFQRVKNPFEATWERLHLPIIASPSLFQRSATPQLSSTQFEWSIEQVSSLKPAQVEPHETQFHDSPDPEYEAKAQSAISSFFKDQQIVPSPVDCPLRSQRIILSELNSNTPITKPKRIRDCGTQTALSLPFNLPKELEDALRPYFQPHLAVSDTSYAEDSISSSMYKSCASGTDAKDISMRRKLFDMHNIIVLDNDNKTSITDTPTTSGQKISSSPLHAAMAMQRTTIVGKLSDTLDQSYIGSLSPISSTDGFSLSPQSPHTSAAMRKSKLQHFRDDVGLSPILSKSPLNENKNIVNKNRFISMDNYRNVELNTSEQAFGDLDTSVANENKFTPDRSSSPLHCLESTELSTDSFNLKVSRLKVNTKNRSLVKTKSTAELDLFAHDETDEMIELDDDDMQVSQLSVASVCSSNSDTPRGKRRSASRKNLSQSFSAKWLEESDDNSVQNEIEKIIITKVKDESPCNAPIMLPETTDNMLNPKMNQYPHFYRTDSGFNEMTSVSSTSSTIPNDYEQCSNDAANILANHNKALNNFPQTIDINMICSTPSKKSF